MATGIERDPLRLSYLQNQFAELQTEWGKLNDAKSLSRAHRSTSSVNARLNVKSESSTDPGRVAAKSAERTRAPPSDKAPPRGASKALDSPAKQGGTKPPHMVRPRKGAGTEPPPSPPVVVEKKTPPPPKKVRKPGWNDEFAGVQHQPFDSELPQPEEGGHGASSSQAPAENNKGGPGGPAGGRDKVGSKSNKKWTPPPWKEERLQPKPFEPEECGTAGPMGAKPPAVVDDDISIYVGAKPPPGRNTSNVSGPPDIVQRMPEPPLEGPPNYRRSNSLANRQSTSDAGYGVGGGLRPHQSYDPPDSQPSPPSPDQEPAIYPQDMAPRPPDKRIKKKWAPPAWVGSREDGGASCLLAGPPEDPPINAGPSYSHASAAPQKGPPSAPSVTSPLGEPPQGQPAQPSPTLNSPQGGAEGALPNGARVVNSPQGAATTPKGGRPFHESDGFSLSDLSGDIDHSDAMDDHALAAAVAAITGVHMPNHGDTGQGAAQANGAKPKADQAKPWCTTLDVDSEPQGEGGEALDRSQVSDQAKYPNQPASARGGLPSSSQDGPSPYGGQRSLQPEGQPPWAGQKDIPPYQQQQPQQQQQQQHQHQHQQQHHQQHQQHQQQHQQHQQHQQQYDHMQYMGRKQQQGMWNNQEAARWGGAASQGMDYPPGVPWLNPATQRKFGQAPPLPPPPWSRHLSAGANLGPHQGAVGGPGGGALDPGPMMGRPNSYDGERSALARLEMQPGPPLRRPGLNMTDPAPAPPGHAAPLRWSQQQQHLQRPPLPPPAFPNYPEHSGPPNYGQPGWGMDPHSAPYAPYSGEGGNGYGYRYNYGGPGGGQPGYGMGGYGARYPGQQQPGMASRFLEPQTFQPAHFQGGPRDKFTTGWDANQGLQHGALSAFTDVYSQRHRQESHTLPNPRLAHHHQPQQYQEPAAPNRLQKGPTGFEGVSLEDALASAPKKEYAIPPGPRKKGQEGEGPPQ